MEEWERQIQEEVERMAKLREEVRQELRGQKREWDKQTGWRWRDGLQWRLFENWE